MSFIHSKAYFLFKISTKGKEEILKLVIHIIAMFYLSSLSSKGLSLFHRGNASGGLDSSSVSCCDSEVLTALSLSLWQDSS